MARGPYGLERGMRPGTRGPSFAPCLVENLQRLYGRG